MRSQRFFHTVLFLGMILAATLMTTRFVFPTDAQGTSCPGAPASRLSVGEQGIVGAAGANNVRSEAATSGTLLGQIPGGGAFIVLEGPVCANGFAWWRVDYNGLIGWTAEGQGADYWLEPAGPVPTQAPTVTVMATEPAEPACPGFMPSRLIVGERGSVVPGPANNVRAEPSASAERTGDIPGGETFLVLEGPVCAGGFAWWRVDYHGRVGWTPEGSGTDYWLEPAGPVPTQAPTLTPTITLTPRPTLTPSPTYTPAPVMPEVRLFSNIQSLISKPVGEREPITHDNIGRIEPLSILGRGDIQQFVLSPDEKLLAVRSGLGVWLMNLDATNTEGILLETQDLPVTTIDFSPDGKYLAVGGSHPIETSTLQVWNTGSITRVPLSRTFKEDISAVRFTPNGQLIVSIPPVNQELFATSYLVNIADDTVTGLPVRSTGRVSKIAVSSDGGLIATSDNSLIISLYNLANDTHQFNHEIQGALGDLVIDDLTNQLISAGGGGNPSTPGVLRVWDLATSQRVFSPQFERDIRGLALSPDGKTLAVYTGYDRMISIWDMQTLEEKAEVELPLLFKAAFIKADGSFILSHYDGTIRAWDSEFKRNQVLFDFSGPNVNESAAVNKDGSKFVFGMNNTLYLWDTASGEILDSVSDELNYAAFIAFDPDSSVVRYAFGSQDYSWDTATGDKTLASRLLIPTPTPSVSSDSLMSFASSLYPGYGRYYVRSAHFVPGTNSNLLAVTHGDVITFWETNTRLPLSSFRSRGNIIGFSEDGSLILTKSEGAFWLWGVPK